MMNLKTSKASAIELAASNHNNIDLELKGLKALSEFNKSISLSLNSNLDVDTSFETIFGYDCSFFYNIEQIKNDKVIVSEYGIGHIESIDNKIFLKRHLPIYLNSHNKITQCSNGPYHFKCDSPDYLVAHSVLPSSYLELLANSNCVIASSEPFCPNPISIDNFSFLGRLNDNVQSIPFSELFSNPELITAILEVITTYSKQLSLKTSKLESKRLCTDCLQLNTSDKPLEKKNSLIFDGENLKFYDGEKWKIIQWRDSPT